MHACFYKCWLVLRRCRLGPCRLRFIFFTSLLLLFCHVCYGQRTKIESLKKVLPALQGNAQVDCLNILSLAYTYLNADTAKLYAQKAYDQAEANRYFRGIGMSLNNKARIAGIAYHDFPLEEKICLQTIQSYKSLNDEKVLAETYMNLALALFCQGYFDRSAQACDLLIRLSKKVNDKIRQGEAEAVLGSISFETGNYDKSFQYFNQSLAIFQSIDDSYNIAILLAKIGDLYCLAGDNKTGLSFYFQSLQYPLGPTIIWHPLVDMGDTYYSLEQYDSGTNKQEKYVQTIKSLTIRSNYMAYPRVRKAESLIGSKNYRTALNLLNEDLKSSMKGNDRNQVMRLLFDIVKAYSGQGNYAKAFHFTNELLQNARNYKAQQYILSAYKLKYNLYDNLHQVDSSYQYYKKYTGMRDSIALGEFGKKMQLYTVEKENEKKQGQIELLNKEKLINQQLLQLSSQRLKNESFQKTMLVIGVLVLVLTGFIVFRNINLKRKNEANRREIVENELTLQKLKSEKTRIELQNQAIELKMQALRSQMNPHFIFNCLNSINRFTIKNEASKAADYLTKFAKLIRIVLQQSGSSFIPLEEELNSLQLYMDLEALRFESPFSYEICTNCVDLTDIKVPPLLLQPFVENAIWHGLHPKQNVDGKIKIDLKLSGDVLDCSICDNGVGRPKANGMVFSDNKEKKSSLGMKLTQNRLELFEYSLDERKAVITINDLTDHEGQSAGTCVSIKIPVKSV